jgi:hypothetical protein
MVRHFRLIAQVALIAGLAVLAFPAGGSALNAAGISLTSSGPSPAVLTIPAGIYPVWLNNDTVTHTVDFANGLCSIQIAPGAVGQCPLGLSVGAFPYTVDGTVQASVTVTPHSRTVTLRAGRHEIKRGARLTLRGFLNYDFLDSPPVTGGTRTSMRVTVLARSDRRHPFRAVATVRAGGVTARGAYRWLRHIRPRRTTIYMVEANSQPASGQYWQPAHSRPFKIVVRPRARRER